MTYEIDWQAALDGTRPVTTRDGKKVTLYCVDAPGKWPVHGRIEGNDVPTSWNAHGNYQSRGKSSYDLFQSPPPKPFKSGSWVNVYPPTVSGPDVYQITVSEPYDNKAAADAIAHPGRIACVRVVIEGNEGDGL